MTEVFASVGAITTLSIAFCLLFGVTAALITAIKEWLRAKNELLRATKNLTDTEATEAEAIAAWNTRTHGTLTAEQVHDAIERNFGKVAVIDDGGEKVEWREGWVCNVGFNSQAIADELNALLGSGTCEDISTTHGLFICSVCGCRVLEEGVDFGGINFCPDCGKAVER